MANLTSRIGAYVRARRVAAGLSLRRVANDLGVTHVFLGEVERGKKALPRERWSALAAIVPGVEQSDLEEISREAERVDAQLSLLRDAPMPYQSIVTELALRRSARRDDYAEDDRDLQTILAILRGER